MGHSALRVDAGGGGERLLRTFVVPRHEPCPAQIRERGEAPRIVLRGDLVLRERFLDIALLVEKPGIGEARLHVSRGLAEQRLIRAEGTLRVARLLGGGGEHPARHRVLRVNFGGARERFARPFEVLLVEARETEVDPRARVLRAEHGDLAEPRLCLVVAFALHCRDAEGEMRVRVRRVEALESRRVLLEFGGVAGLARLLHSRGKKVQRILALLVGRVQAIGLRHSPPDTFGVARLVRQHAHVVPGALVGRGKGRDLLVDLNGLLELLLLDKLPGLGLELLHVLSLRGRDRKKRRARKHHQALLKTDSDKEHHIISLADSD